MKLKKMILEGYTLVLFITKNSKGKHSVDREGTCLGVRRTNFRISLPYQIGNLSYSVISMSSYSV